MAVRRLMEFSDLNTRQVANALVIFAAALPFGVEAAAAALMAAGAESSYKRYANDGESTRPEVWAAYGGRQNFRDVIRQSLLFPHDAVAGAAWTTADSVGLFQQRPMFDYGTIKDLMDPAESTRIFIRGSHEGKGRTRFFLQSPPGLTLAQRVQWTQGSEFPTGENYAPMLTVVSQLVAHFGGAAPIITAPTNPVPPPAPTVGDVLEDIMADRRPFIHFPYDGSMCEADVWNKTWSRIPDPQTLEDRKYVLQVANFPAPVLWSDLTGEKGDVANPAAFGREIPWKG
jgi:hypothetical protein